MWPRRFGQRLQEKSAKARGNSYANYKPYWIERYKDIMERLIHDPLWSPMYLSRLEHQQVVDFKATNAYRDALRAWMSKQPNNQTTQPVTTKTSSSAKKLSESVDSPTIITKERPIPSKEADFQAQLNTVNSQAAWLMAQLESKEKERLRLEIALSASIARSPPRSFQLPASTPGPSAQQDKLFPQFTNAVTQPRSFAPPTNLAVNPPTALTGLVTGQQTKQGLTGVLEIQPAQSASSSSLKREASEIEPPPTASAKKLRYTAKNKVDWGFSPASAAGSSTVARIESSKAKKTPGGTPTRSVAPYYNAIVKKEQAGGS